VVGVPAAADVARLPGFLSHFGNHRIAGDGGEKAVDVDRRKTLGKGDVLLRGETLISEEDDAIFAERAEDLGKGVVGEGLREIDTGDLAPTRGDTGSTRMRR